MHKTPHAFGVALRLLRTSRRLKQWEVAEKAGMTKAMLSSYETGKVTPTLQSLITLFEALETDFFGFQDALETVDRTDRILEEGPAPRELAPTGGGNAVVLKEDGSQLLEILVLRLNGIEGQLERIATDIGRVAHRAVGEMQVRAVPQELDQ
jgi:transcriptional regulator with XRE-family HTH domain